MSDLLMPTPENAIREPGIYEISHSDYLADPVVVPSLSRSVAQVLLEQSPAHAWAAHPRFNRELISDSSDEMDVGSAAHMIFLKGESCVELVDVTDWRTKKAKEARAEIQARGHIALKKDRFHAVHRMVSVLERFRQTTGAFTDGAAEQTMVWREGSVWCRAKVDWLPHEPSAPLWDLKTTSTRATLRKWTRSAYDFGGDLQAAMYPRGAECIRGEPPDGMNFLVIEAEEPHGLAVFQFSPTALAMADAKVRHAIKTWSWCMEDNRWPGYAIDPQWIEPPVWMVREWEGLLAETDIARRQRMNDSDNLADRILATGNYG